MGVSKLLEGEGEELGERRGVEGACEEDGQGTVEITFFPHPKDATSTASPLGKFPIPGVRVLHAWRVQWGSR